MLKITYNPMMAIINGVLPEQVSLQLHQELAYKAKGIDAARAIFYASRGKRNKVFAHWDGWTRLYNNKYQSFATGLLERVLGILAQHDLPFELNPVAGWEPTAMTGTSRLHVGTLRSDQLRVVQSLLAQPRAAVQAPTGSGKTVVTSELCARFPALKVLICVPTLGLLGQTRREVARFTGERVGIWGDGEWEDGRIVVATVQTASKDLPDLKTTQGRLPKELSAAVKARIAKLSEFRMVIYDEAHLVGSDSHRVLGYFLSNAWVRYGMSATLRREDLADKLLEGIIGPKVCEVALDELIDAEVLQDVMIEMPEYQHPDARLRLKWNDTKDQVLKAVDRSDFVLFQVYRLLALEGYANAIVTYRYEEHGKQLVRRWREYFPEYRINQIDGDSDTDTRDEAIAKLASGATQVLFGSSILDIGINVPPAQTLVPAGAESGKNLLMQRVGRILRTHATKTRPCKVVDVYDKGNKYLEDHASERLGHYTEVYGFGRVWLIDVDGERRKAFGFHG